jgi:hypothetical protein
MAIVAPVAAYPLLFDVATLVRAETDLASLVNDQRTTEGLVPLQLDPEAMAIAEERARTMAATDVMSHTDPGGRTVFDAIDAAGIRWFGAGEVLVWNTYATEPESTERAVTAWLASADHRQIILSGKYNYAGFGAAVSPTTGIRYYAGVLLRIPDTTGGWARFRSARVQILSAVKARVTVHWVGADTRLQALTAGLRDFEVQRRVVGGAWYSLGWTRLTSLSTTLLRHRTYEFRIRARDNAGNVGGWSSAFVRT